MEFVFVVERTRLFPEHAPHGLALFGDSSETSGTGENGDAERGKAQHRETEFPRWDQKAFQTCVEEHGFFVERPFAERTPALKQIIPYALVVRGKEVLLLRRTKGGGEARLHDKLTIGVGGHINPVDAIVPPADSSVTSSTKSDRLRDPLPAATRREVMEEELRIEGDVRIASIGLINDDSNPVGAVHVGLVQVLHLEEGGTAEVRETDQLEGHFVPVEELIERLHSGANFETWSSLIVPHLTTVLTLSQSLFGLSPGSLGDPSATLPSSPHAANPSRSSSEAAAMS